MASLHRGLFSHHTCHCNTNEGEWHWWTLQGGSHRSNYARAGPSDVSTVQRIIIGEKQGKEAVMHKKMMYYGGW